MVRLDNWPMLLSVYLRERKNMPFEWGKNDCMAFVSDGVKALTGHDFFPDFSDYHDEESAKVMLEKSGGPAGIIAKCLGHNGSRNIKEAQRGDLVIAKLPEVTGGIVDDTGRSFCVVTPEGLRRFPMTQAWRYWSY